MAPLPGDYQEPDEVIAGQPVPAESFNKYGNSIIWLKNKIGDPSTFDDIAPTTTKGDLIVHGASSNERLAVGGGSQFLMSTGEMPTWQILDPYLNMSAVEQGQLPVAHGGTGADLSATGGSGHVLKQGSEGADVTVEALAASDIPSLDASKITTGALPIARGGTGQTSAAAALIALSPTNTRGDLIVRGATEHERLSIGGSGRFLQSNGTDPSWQLLSASDIPNLAASKVTSGQLAVARGGTGADLSSTGGAGHVLKQSSTGANVTVGVLAASDIPSLDTSKLTSGQLAIARGGTGADLSATGGSGHVLKQATAGGAVTVGALAASDIPSLDTAKLTSGQLASARGGVPSGTSFPGSPVTGDRFFRTDRGLEYFHDGTRWLTSGLFDVRMPYTTNSAATDNFSGMAPFPGLYTPYFTRLDVMCNTGATNNGSNYWSFAFGQFGAAYATLTTAALGSGLTDQRLSTNTFSQPVTIPAYIYIKTLRTGAPSDTTFWAVGQYRYIG